MQIWVIGRGVPTKENNMFGSFEFEQAALLQRHGHTVIYPVFRFLSIRLVNKWHYYEKEVSGVRVCAVGFFNRFNRGQTRVAVRNFFLKRMYRKIEKKYGVPDVIHIHYPTAWKYDLFKPLQEKGARIVATEHWTKVQSGDVSSFYRRNLRQYFDHAEAILAVGEELARSMQTLTGSERKVELIPNIVNSDFTYRDETVPGEFRFVACGRLVEVKGFDLLVQAFFDAFSDDKNVFLDIIGEGEFRDKIQNTIVSLNLTGRVRLLGVMEHKQVAQYFHRCNALVCSSTLETFGVPVIEAMAAGMPVVTTDAIGFKGLFHEEHGYVVPVNDREKLASAMKKLYDHYSDFDRKKISEYAQEKFSEEKVYDQLMYYYSRKNKG